MFYAHSDVNGYEKERARERERERERYASLPSMAEHESLFLLASIKGRSEVACAASTCNERAPLAGTLARNADSL
jgi:hypothetical protein